MQFYYWKYVENIKGKYFEYRGQDRGNCYINTFMQPIIYLAYTAGQFYECMSAIYRLAYIYCIGAPIATIRACKEIGGNWD
jgi:hypothetical protein